jgi:hypothetical protein
MTKFRTGDRVADIETGQSGRVITCVTDPETTDEIAVVWFDGDVFASAFPAFVLRHAAH